MAIQLKPDNLTISNCQRSGNTVSILENLEKMWYFLKNNVKELKFFRILLKLINYRL